MPIATISNIYVTTDVQRVQPDEYAINAQRKFTDILVIILLVPTIIALALVFQAFMQNGWNDELFINFCILGLVILFAVALILSLHYIICRIRSLIRQNSSTNDSSSMVSTMGPSDFAYDGWYNHGHNAMEKVHSIDPPNYVNVVKGENVLPPSYDSITNVEDNKDNASSRAYTTIPMYI